MLEILRKRTDAERELGAVESIIQVKNYWTHPDDESCWSCDVCKLLYEPEDEAILVVNGTEKNLLCPNVRTRILGRFFKVRSLPFECRNRMSFAKKGYYESRYMLKQL